MKNSWLYKLLGAFLLVILIGGLVTSYLTSRGTRTAFDLFMSRNSQILAERLKPDLADYYAQNTSWDGVDVWFQDNYLAQRVPSEPNGMMSGQGNGPGNGQGNGPGNGQGNNQSLGMEMAPPGGNPPPADDSMMGAFGQRIILADGKGFVVYDSQDEYTGQHLPAANLSEGIAITVDSSTVGTLLVTNGRNPNSEYATPADEFLSSTRKAVISSSLIAGAIAVILGIFLFSQVTAPLRKLQKATTAIAGGDLDQRVDIKGKDEFAQLGQTFNKMADSLSQAEVQRQHLMADVAHELRTPLTAIQGTIEGMQDGILPVDAEQLDALFAETTILNRLIGDLRLLSLAEARQLKLETGEVNLSELMSQIVERNQPQARLKEIQLKLKNQDRNLYFVADSDRITQVMNNLITNAMRYTTKGGQILVETEAQPASSPMVRITVTDTGEGINPQDLPFVFDRFYRADKSRSRSSGGSGLGLAIVKELVEAHGGKVWAESPVFKKEGGKAYGTKFILEFPAL